MSYYLKILKDHPFGFWPLDESSGSSAVDISGCGNDGVYVGGILNDGLPLVAGGVSANKITSSSSITLSLDKDYSGYLKEAPFGNINYSDNDFTREMWAYLNISTNNITKLFSDSTSDVGLFYQNGNIVFKVQSEMVEYTVPYLKTAQHIVATYSKNYINLYINGKHVSEKQLDNFSFTNDPSQFSIGPTENSADSFIVDAPAIYRYALTPRVIAMHYFYARTLPDIQIVYPERGCLFTMTDKNLSPTSSFIYPVDKKLQQFEDDFTYYDPKYGSLEFVKTVDAVAGELIIEDMFSIPSGLNLNTSKVEWYGENGISVEVSDDGINYEFCENGGVIPQYKNGSFSSTGLVYLRVTMSTSDTSRYLPKLKYLGFYFYTKKNVYSNTSGSYIQAEQPTSGTIDLTAWDYSLATDNYPILSRNYENGLRAQEGGFSVTTIKSINTVEMFFSPKSLNKCYLLYADIDGGEVSYSWAQDGSISKNNIDGIFINGIDHTASTNISNVLEQDSLYHIVILLAQPISNKIWFNVKSTGGTWSDGGDNNLYKNLSLYDEVFDSNKALSHYDLYISRPISVLEDSVGTSISMTEESVISYDNDWLVIKNT